MKRVFFTLALGLLVTGCADTMVVSGVRCSTDTAVSYDYRGGPPPSSLHASVQYCDPYRQAAERTD